MGMTIATCRLPAGAMALCAPVIAAAALACGGGGDTTCGASNPCPDGEFCSVTGDCVVNGRCAADGDCDPGMMCGKLRTCLPAVDRCGRAVQVPPEVLFVLDRSCSMQPAIGNTTKWAAAVNAITTVVNKYSGRLYFGLILFPDKIKPNCSEDSVAATPGPSGGDAIRSLLTAALDTGDQFYPSGPCVTNIDTAMGMAQQITENADKGRDTFALLVTDGVQSDSCGGHANDVMTEGTIAGMYAHGTPTFVVGFNAQADKDELNRFAEAGGVANTDPAAEYYPAQDDATLLTVLDGVAQRTLTCDLPLPSDPPCADEIYVFFESDGAYTAVGESAVDGWSPDLAARRIVLNGSACDRVRSGSIGGVSIVYGLDCGATCPSPSD